MYGARFVETFTPCLKSPIELAESIGNKTLCEVLAHHKIATETNEKLVFNMSLNIERESTGEQESDTPRECEETISNTRKPKSIVITTGDVKTTMTIRRVRNRSPDEFRSFTEAPGDFHSQGYVMQCIAKIMGPGGFYYVVKQLLGRAKVTPSSFEKIFNEENFERNFNAVKDFYWGVLIACVKEFEAYTNFPPSSIVNDETIKDNSQFVLKCFKEWLESNRSDDTFNYLYLFVVKYGTLLLKLHRAVRMGNGKAREACWMEMLPLFATMQKKNYNNEAFVHIVNFTSLWPLAYREMFCRNCTVNVSGKHFATILPWMNISKLSLLSK